MTGKNGHVVLKKIEDGSAESLNGDVTLWAMTTYPVDLFLGYFLLAFNQRIKFKT
jgi:hypothetical protein